jgi:hypothetical protein
MVESPEIALLEQPRGRVLLATGEHPVRLGVRGILARRNFGVHEASERTTAMEILERNPAFDAMIVGADLPPDGAFSFLFDLDDPPPTLLIAGMWLTPPAEVLDRYPCVSAVVGKPFALRYLLGALEHTVAKGPRELFGPAHGPRAGATKNPSTRNYFGPHD